MKLLNWRFSVTSTQESPKAKMLLFPHLFCIIHQYAFQYLSQGHDTIFKENLIFLNTFLAIFCHKTNFCCLSVSINQKCSTKIRLHMTYVPAYFCVVLSNNFDFFNLRDTKNHFHHKILLEMCSETSNSPSNTVS